MLRDYLLTKESDYDMSASLKLEYFDDVVTTAFMTAAVPMDDEEELKSPSTAIKLGYDTK